MCVEPGSSDPAGCTQKRLCEPSEWGEKLWLFWNFPWIFHPDESSLVRRRAGVQLPRVCAVFLKKASDEKCSCARLGSEHAFLQWWYHFYGVQVRAHPALFHRKEGNFTIIYLWKCWNKTVDYISPSLQFALFCKAAASCFLLWCTICVYFLISRCFHAIASCFSPLQWRPCVSDSDYLFGLKCFQTLITF